MNGEFEDEDQIPEFDFSEFLRTTSHRVAADASPLDTATNPIIIGPTVREDDSVGAAEPAAEAAPQRDKDSGEYDDDPIPELDCEQLLNENPHLVPPSTPWMPTPLTVENTVPLLTSKLPKQYEPQVIHLLKKVDLVSMTFSIVLPVFSLLHLIIAAPPLNSTLVKIWVVYYLLTELSLTAGYHRFFTHQSYHCHIVVQFIMAVIGTSCGLGSILQFSSQHLAHHRYSDTERDPQSLSLYGWWFAQWGHKLFKGNKKSAKAVADCRKTLVSSVCAPRNKQLRSTQLVVPPSYSLLKWQEENYYILWIITNLFIPTILAFTVCQLSVFSCVFYLGLIRMSLVQQQWLLSGSLGHLKTFPFASQPFDDSRSAVDLPLSIIGQIITFGESNHNFHHEFPGDYRNGPTWYAFDPAKWAINLLAHLGLVHHMHSASSDQIDMCRVQQQQKLLDGERSKLQWGIPIDRLPMITPEQFAAVARKDYEEKEKALVAIEGIIHDVTPFMHDHPGGMALVVASVGKDATPAFNGAVYAHSTAARNLLATMRVARLTKGSCAIQTSWENHLLNDSQGQRIVRNRTQATVTRDIYYAASAA
ncbi:AaceriAAL078Wp [[Ashbya] aceris (nom. inval.)]|nr:AaceriAAL078Wp [[Ashbya] aceris (nom. inval.)]